VESEEHDRWQSTYDQMMQMVLARRYEDAVSLIQAARDSALQESDRQEAASYAHLLSTCLTLVKRDAEAVEACEQAEAFDPANVQYKVTTATLFLENRNSPERALAKAEEAVALAPPGNLFRNRPRG